MATGCGIWWQSCRVWLAASRQYELGKYAYLSGDFQAAAHRFDEALVLRPAHVLARKWLAQCRFWLGEPDRAATLFAECEQAIALESDGAIVYALSLCDASRIAQAKSICTRWLRVAPSSPHVWASKAAVLAHEGEDQDALAALERAVRLGLNDTSALRRSEPVRALLASPAGEEIHHTIRRIWQISE